MPRFYAEPRPYCLIRAQKQNPFFLARASCHFSLQTPATLCKFRPLQQRELRAATATASRAATATAIVALPSSLSLLLSATSSEPKTRDHHAILLPSPSRLASNHRCLVSRPTTTTRDHHASPLSPSRLAFGHAAPTSRPSLCLSASVPASLHHHANIFVLLPQLLCRGFLEGKFPTRFCLIFCFCVC